MLPLDELLYFGEPDVHLSEPDVHLREPSVHTRVKLAEPALGSGGIRLHQFTQLSAVSVHGLHPGHEVTACIFAKGVVQAMRESGGHGHRRSPRRGFRRV